MLSLLASRVDVAVTWISDSSRGVRPSPSAANTFVKLSIGAIRFVRAIMYHAPAAMHSIVRDAACVTARSRESPDCTPFQLPCPGVRTAKRHTPAVRGTKGPPPRLHVRPVLSSSQHAQAPRNSISSLDSRINFQAAEVRWTLGNRILRVPWSSVSRQTENSCRVQSS